jgi:hypothetical protein
MTEEQKDKLWVDYFVTRFFWNKLTNNNATIVGILDFHNEYENPIQKAQQTGLDNYESWNWKWSVIK